MRDLQEREDEAGSAAFWSGGDTLIVSELSHLGRSVGEIITRVDRLVHQQMRVFALKEGL
jgi:DNA invertase Pin-like site-specific DNA recombinase